MCFADDSLDRGIKTCCVFNVELRRFVQPCVDSGICSRIYAPAPIFDVLCRFTTRDRAHRKDATSDSATPRRLRKGASPTKELRSESRSSNVSSTRGSLPTFVGTGREKRRGKAPIQGQVLLFRDPRTTRRPRTVQDGRRKCFFYVVDWVGKNHDGGIFRFED